MSKPYIHAKSSARRYGGKPEDYMDIHEKMDQSKSALADVRHRAVFHSAFGIYVVQDIFGQTRTNSDGKVYSVRDIAEQHIMEDLGFIPTLQQWMEGAEIQPWMMGKKDKKASTHIPFDSEVEAKPAEPAPLTPAEIWREMERIQLPQPPAVPLPYLPPPAQIPWPYIPTPIDRTIAID